MTVRLPQRGDRPHNFTHRAVLEQQRRRHPWKRVDQLDGDFDNLERIATECLEPVELFDFRYRRTERTCERAVDFFCNVQGSNWGPGRLRGLNLEGSRHGHTANCASERGCT